jgi:hypothetical protein
VTIGAVYVMRATAVAALVRVSVAVGRAGDAWGVSATFTSVRVRSLNLAMARTVAE